MRCLVVVLSLAFAAVASTPGLAQPSGRGSALSDTSSAKAASLTEALERFATEADISLVYSTKLVGGRSAGDHLSSCTDGSGSPDTTLRCLLRGTGLEYAVTSGGTYVVRRPVQNSQMSGAILGTVRGTEDTRLVNAHVRLIGTEGRSVADSAGVFRFSGLEPGQKVLVVSHVGYETARTEVRVVPGDTARHQIRLSPSPISTPPLVVERPAEPTSSEHSYVEISADRPLQSAGGKASGVMGRSKSLMGTSSRPPYMDLHLQGGSNGEHIVQIYGAPVRNPTVSGRLLSAFSPLAVEGIDAHKAGFTPLSGNALSGILSLEAVSPKSDQHMSLKVSPLSTSGRVGETVENGTFSASAMLAGRRSVWDLHRSSSLAGLMGRWSVLDPVLGAEQLSSDSLIAGGRFGEARSQPRNYFHDLHGNLRLSSGASQLRLSFYRGVSDFGSDLSLVPNRPDVSDEDDAPRIPMTDRYKWENTVGKARFRSELSSHVSASVGAHFSSYRSSSTYEAGSLEGSSVSESGFPALARSDGSSSSVAVDEVSLNGSLDLDLPREVSLTVEGKVTRLRSRFRFENAFIEQVAGKRGDVRTAGAANMQVNLTPRTVLEGGMRFTFSGGHSTLYAEPRISLRRFIPLGEAGDLVVRSRAGIYRQFATRFRIIRDATTTVVPSVQVWAPVPGSLSPPKAYHLASDIKWQPAPRWQITGEVFGKEYAQLLSVDYPRLISSPSGASMPLKSVLSPADGYAYGADVEVTYGREFGRATFSYSFSRSRREYPGQFQGRKVPSSWAAPHEATVGVQFPLTTAIQAQLRAKGVWARKWGYRRSYYMYLTSKRRRDGWEEPDLRKPSSHELPPLYRSSIGLMAQQTWNGVEIVGRIGIFNPLGRENVVDWGLRPTSNGTLGRHSRTLTGRNATASIRISY